MIDLPFARKGFKYNVYKFYLEELFGEPVHRLSVKGDFTCPNRDGNKGFGGCIYCNNESFIPFYHRQNETVAEQISKGIEYLRSRFNAAKFIVYFQSYTNTYAPVSELEKKYRQALDHDDVVGLAVSTRPDCLDDDIMSLLSDIGKNHYLNLEIGIESIYEKSLKWMNRCHGCSDTYKALDLIEKYNIDTTAHIILGLPTETRDEMMSSAEKMNQMPLKFIAGLSPHFVLQRLVSQTPDPMLIAPRWEHTTTAFLMDLQRYMRQNKLFQGKKLP